MVSFARYILVVLCALFIAACASTASAPSTIRQQQASDGLSITLDGTEHQAVFDATVTQ